MKKKQVFVPNDEVECNPLDDVRVRSLRTRKIQGHKDFKEGTQEQEDLLSPIQGTTAILHGPLCSIVLVGEANWL